jgi:hypothetical protein
VDTQLYPDRSSAAALIAVLMLGSGVTCKQWSQGEGEGEGGDGISTFMSRGQRTGQLYLPCEDTVRRQQPGLAPGRGPHRNPTMPALVSDILRPKH